MTALKEEIKGNKFLGEILSHKRKRRRKRRIVNHHISYDPEWIVKIFDLEHMVLSRLQWAKTFSKGFFIALKDFIEKNEDKAVDLG